MLHRARDLTVTTADGERGPLSFGRLRGHIAELSGPAALEAVCGVVREAQQRKAAVIWVLGHRLPPFAPDLELNGVTVSSIPFVFAPHPLAAAQAAEHSLRGKAFELVLVDLAWPGEPVRGLDPGPAAPRRRSARKGRAPELGLRSIDDAVLGRLLRLCEAAHAALLFITAAPGDLSASLVFARFTTERKKRTCDSARSGSQAGVPPGIQPETQAGTQAAVPPRRAYEYIVTLSKTKTGRPGEVYREVLRGPHGML